jgi:hypothetical protein
MQERRHGETAAEQRDEVAPGNREATATGSDKLNDSVLGTSRRSQHRNITAVVLSKAAPARTLRNRHE